MCERKRACAYLSAIEEKKKKEEKSKDFWRKEKKNILNIARDRKIRILLLGMTRNGKKMCMKKSLAEEVVNLDIWKVINNEKLMRNNGRGLWCTTKPKEYNVKTMRKSIQYFV